MEHSKTLEKLQQLLTKHKQHLKELYRITSYGIIGVVLTGCVYVLWTLLLILLGQMGFDNESATMVGATNFVAGFTFIIVSYYLNKKISFRGDQTRYRNNSVSLLIFFGSYTFTTLTSSLLTFFIVSQTFSVDLELIKLFVVVFNAALNFCVQRFVIYTPSS